MHFSTIMTAAIVAISTVAALPATKSCTESKSKTSATPAPTVSTYRLQAKSAGINPTVDSVINGLYVEVSTGPNYPDSVLSSNTATAPEFVFVDGDKAVKFKNGKSLVLTSTTSPLGTNQHYGIAKWGRGGSHSELAPYEIRGGHCFNSNHKDWYGWLACESQYGPYLGWVDNEFNLTAHNAANPFPCTIVALCQDLVV